MTVQMIAEVPALSGPFAAALASDHDGQLRALEGADAADRLDRVLVLQQIYDLHRRPLHEVGAAVRWQHHAVVADIKTRLETAWIAELDAAAQPTVDALRASADTAEQLRRLAAKDRAPAIYQWVAEEGALAPVLHFLALEAGPDDLFDDLVATCQIGLPLGPAKMELASNYWDEMGNGNFEDVHNVLYQRFVDAVDLPDIPREDHPIEALERAAMLGLVATNRWLQPEMLGALGLIELEAGPHCRYVDIGLGRLGASDDARAFYKMHAVVDPVHGKGWLENAVAPLVSDHPDWGPRILRGAAWKCAVNVAFFDWAHRTLAADAAP